jgi:D-tyrosyl-tRNA(Tyr) deacylase
LISLIQRVSEASVRVAGETVGAIGPGLLALIGVRPSDVEADVERLLVRMLRFRVFDDGHGRMNLSLRDVGGGLLLVPQFTLAAETHKGTRPGFSTAAPPEQAARLFVHLQQRTQSLHPAVASGVFGANMQVALVGDGPVTFWLES